MNINDLPDNETIEHMFNALQGSEGYSASFASGVLMANGYINIHEVTGNESFLDSIGKGIQKVWQWIKDTLKKIWDFFFGKSAKEKTEATKKDLERSLETAKVITDEDFEEVKDLFIEEINRAYAAKVGLRKQVGDALNKPGIIIDDDDQLGKDINKMLNDAASTNKHLDDVILGDAKWLKTIIDKGDKVTRGDYIIYLKKELDAFKANIAVGIKSNHRYGDLQKLVEKTEKRIKEAGENLSAEDKKMIKAMEAIVKEEAKAVKKQASLISAIVKSSSIGNKLNSKENKAKGKK